MFEGVVKFGLKTGIFARRGVSGLERGAERHKALAAKAPAIDAEMAALVRPSPEGIRDLHFHFYPSARAAARNAPILSRSFSPGRLSTPEETSTTVAPETRPASGKSSAVKPPDSIHSRRQERPAIRLQSNARPLPPGRASGRLGGVASNSSRLPTSSYRAALKTSSGPAMATAFITGRAKRSL